MFENPESGEFDDPGLGHTNGTLAYDDMEDQVPYLSGSFTGWRYLKMRSVFDLCTNDDKDYSEPFERCQNNGKISK